MKGAVGTLEEAIEILSMRQLKLSNKPLVFINTDGFYDKLNETFSSMIEQEFVKENIRNMFAMTSNPTSALEYIFNSS